MTARHLSCLVLTVALGGCSSPSPEASLKNLKDATALDLAEQFHIASKNGAKPMELCVQAGVVKAAYLQAKDEKQYQVWTALEDISCEEAGIKK
jgi:hypothetical protein